jgi:glycolate oxidase FAD binding subunit
MMGSASLQKMNFKPATVEQLAKDLSSAFAISEKLEGVDLRMLNRILEHTPEDMTVTVEAGITLAALQTELQRHRQWLPVDPPRPELLTIGGLIDADPSGPRRFSHGTIRDYLLGITVVLADGTVIHSGGKVVKNVAGYDLGKLFVGGRGSLGVVVEATFKLRPLPELEHFTEARCNSAAQAGELIEAVLKSELAPVVLDLHNLAAPAPRPPATEMSATVVLGFAGSRQEVEWQIELARQLGISDPSSLDHDAQFWTNAAPVQRLSVLPSKLTAAVGDLRGAPFVARAGNGVIYHRGAPAPRVDVLPLELMRRLKDAYDPRHILPDLVL